MRRWTQMLGRLYPRAWRERYGEEFDALLEDVEPNWKQFCDVLGGAVKMQMANHAAWMNLAAALAASEAALAAAPGA
jgi:hypothetical protein